MSKLRQALFTFGHILVAHVEQEVPIDESKYANQITNTTKHAANGAARAAAAAAANAHQPPPSPSARVHRAARAAAAATALPLNGAPAAAAKAARVGAVVCAGSEPKEQEGRKQQWRQHR
jgi:hypothetical protein